MEELTSERRRSWISAISREDLTDSILENDRVYSKHFVSGEPAKDWYRFNVDWFPTLCLGHSNSNVAGRNYMLVIIILRPLCRLSTGRDYRCIQVLNGTQLFLQR